jgi:7-cyano-7-deazaguanine synthase
MKYVDKRFLMKKAVVSLSGGLDSSTCLGWAIKKGYRCYALTFDYGQRHIKEIESAKKIASYYKVPIYEIKLRFPWFSVSSLVSKNKKLPDLKLSEILSGKIPSTYVPLRNLVFTSIAASYADSVGAKYIILGPNVIDYSGYPDCRPEFYRALEKAINYGSKTYASGERIKILTPIIKMSKAEIIKLAVKLGVPLKLTWSCYYGGEKPCGKCDSCKLRSKGFEEAGLKDPLYE